MAAVFLVVGLVAITLLRHLLTGQLDGTLLRLAAIEASAVTDSPDSAVHFHEGIFNAPQSEGTTELVRYAEVWRADGSPVVRSQSLGTKDLPTSLDALAAARHREVVLVSLVWNGEPLRAVYYPLELVAPVHRAHILQVAAPLRPVGNVLTTLEEFLAGIGIIATGLTFVGGWALAGRAVRPAREIAEQAEAITAGSLGARIRAHADALEYQRLVGVLNDMLERLEAAFDAQRRFVADASHEIRHPLTVLRAALDLALRRDRSPEEYRAAIADGIGQADRVSALAAGLLTLARSDAGVLNPQREEHDLGELAAEACRRMTPIAQARGVHLDGPTESLGVGLDPALVGRALDNLVDNAVKFTPSGGTVRVFVEQDGSDALVHVVDTGLGVAPDQRAHLFERFFRGDPSRAAEGGTGLGLAIARGIAEAHGGTVSYASNPDHGSHFTLRLPR
jgi:two-component system OmpR family sensor kinase